MADWLKKDLTDSEPVKQRLAEEEGKRALARRRAIERNNTKAWYATDQSDATTRFLDTRGSDPFPSIAPSLLNSADIAEYVAATGMIHPFDPTGLKTASYEVKLLGDWTYVNDRGVVEHGSLREGESFILRKNSIAFMTAEPLFQLPDYIALRHNLKINHVYKGLLVGTGPLIDPGFTGRISLPLHNLTRNDYELHGGDGIIWVEFTKLSTNPKWSGKGDRRRKGAVYTPFPPQKTRDKKVLEYINDATRHLGVPSSSSAKIQRNAKKARKVAEEARAAVTTNTRYLTIGGVIALVGLAASLIGPVVVDLRDRASKAEQTIERLEEEIEIIRSGSPQAP